MGFTEKRDRENPGYKWSYTEPQPKDPLSKGFSKENYTLDWSKKIKSFQRSIMSKIIKNTK